MRFAEPVEDARGDEQVLEDEATQAGQAVALGLVTPALGPTPGTPAAQAAPRTPAQAAQAPTTPALMLPGTPERKHEEQKGEMPEQPSLRRGAEDEEVRGGESPKRQRLESRPEVSAAPSSGSGLKRQISDIPGLLQQEAESPKRLRSIQEEFPGGDSLMAEQVLQSELNDGTEDENEGEEIKSKPPEVSDEELARLDDEAIRFEEERLVEMLVMRKATQEEEQDAEAYKITTKMVATWKYRDERNGWFRRARMVARQYKWSVFTEDSFAPTSASVIVRLLIQKWLMSNMKAYILDIKDAFLMIHQPADEKALVTTPNGTYRLLKNLPGQRNTAAQWFTGFCSVGKEYGLEVDVMQPTLMRKKRKPGEEEKEGERIYLTIHVDDLFVVADEPEMEKFLKFIQSKSWKYEKKGPIESGRFSYLKRNMEMTEEGVTIRADPSHIEELSKVAQVEKNKQCGNILHLQYLNWNRYWTDMEGYCRKRKGAHKNWKGRVFFTRKLCVDLERRLCME